METSSWPLASERDLVRDISLSHISPSNAKQDAVRQ
jgi:hypothetical protein